ncbi:hypothetical protein FHR81_001805 [Actinoalloteichus hoggarensis]|uniref:Uncharacterized protein n=1 Tax=Actinoalloteichus hoggarensis TaxID=1470176 RepID=A0A221W5R1_9PSEU|nr:hypothetical protein AHOG_16055 [Actinoalloteichus hoggarensis]MBB5920767.1 hypothetical protein [Actinoalloteichus hoggarensis]
MPVGAGGRNPLERDRVLITRVLITRRLRAAPWTLGR